jgi:hypothetical protein
MKKREYIQDPEWRWRLMLVTAGRRSSYQTLKALSTWRWRRVQGQ